MSFENNAHRTSYKRYFLVAVELTDYNVMINGKTFSDQSVKNYIRTYNIRKIAADHGDDYTTGCLLDYACFKIYYKMIATDLSKQQALDVGPKAIQKLILQKT